MADSLKILIVKLTSLGDVLFSLSLVADLARVRPDVEIHWAVDADFADLVYSLEGIKVVWALPFRSIKRKFRFAKLMQLIRTLKELRGEKYDIAIDLQGMVKSSAVALIARSGKRWVYQKNMMAEDLLWRFFDHYFPAAKTVHALTNYRTAGSYIFGYKFSGRPTYIFKNSGIASENEAALKSRSLILRNRYIIFFPFSSKLVKAIPFEYSADFISRIDRQFQNVSILMLAGSDIERKQALAYASLSARLTLVPPQSLRSVIGLIKQSAGFVGADSGLSYISAACDIPTVTVFVGSDATVLDPGNWAKRASSVHVKQPDWLEICIERLKYYISND